MESVQRTVICISYKDADKQWEPLIITADFFTLYIHTVGIGGARLQAPASDAHRRSFYRVIVAFMVAFLLVFADSKYHFHCCVSVMFSLRTFSKN